MGVFLEDILQDNGIKLIKISLLNVMINWPLYLA